MYWALRLPAQPVIASYWRVRLYGREHVPRGRGVIYASTHRSMIDPILIGSLERRPIFYMAKREAFASRALAWLITSMGAFPVDRGRGDAEAFATAKAILARGDSLVIFPEGRRVRPGPPGEPRSGVGRLALETGAPVVPVALHGTDGIRRGWRVRPRKVRGLVGPPLAFARDDRVPRERAVATTAEIWSHVREQWALLAASHGDPRRPRGRANARAGPRG